MEAMPLECDRVAYSQTTPAHQQCHGAQSGAVRFDVDETAAIVADPIGRLHDSRKFIGREVVSGDLDDLDLSQSQRRILLDVSAPDASPEKADQPALLLLLGQRSIAPRTTKGEESIQIDFVEVLKSLRERPGE